eukprot:gene11398-23849_t
MTWREVVDEGLVSVVTFPNRLNEQEHLLYVVVPYLVVRMCACWKDNLINPSEEEEFFLEALDKVVGLALGEEDMVMDPWEQWKRFGAYFHCIRINSLLILGITQTSLGNLFFGANFSDNSTWDIQIQLHPARIFISDEPLSESMNMNKVLGEKNTSRSVDLIKSCRCYVVVHDKSNSDEAKVAFEFIRKEVIHTTFLSLSSLNAALKDNGHDFQISREVGRHLMFAIPTKESQTDGDDVIALEGEDSATITDLSTTKQGKRLFSELTSTTIEEEDGISMDNSGDT